MKQRILVPLDGSPLAETALSEARLMAQVLDCAITLLHVIMPVTAERAYLFPTSRLQHDWEDYHSRAQEYLHTVQARLAEDGIEAACCVDEGFPADVITRHIENDPAVAMAVIATHGRSGLQRWFLGSVADKVFHAVRKPVMIVRPAPKNQPVVDKGQYRTILVPLDGSSIAAQAIDMAQQIGKNTGATLVLLGAVPNVTDLIMGVGDTLPLWMEEQLQEEKDRLTKYLDLTAQQYVATGGKARTRVVYGQPAEEILHACTDEKADLIVMASHGRSGMQRLWYGSVATKVVNAAAVPLLIIHASIPNEPGTPL
ncbi:MAG: universal stress protein [Herpetosiphonaceae bacterium]|nr:universal stress protein [Herpetosiphonaceae bacterium]